MPMFDGTNYLVHEKSRINILEERNVLRRWVAKICENFSRKRKLCFRCWAMSIIVKSITAMFATYRRWNTAFISWKPWIFWKTRIFLVARKFWRWFWVHTPFEQSLFLYRWGVQSICTVRKGSVSRVGFTSLGDFFCSQYQYCNKCLHLAGEKFVLAGESNLLSLATGLASWKVSLEPCLLLKNWLQFKARLRFGHL